MILELDAAVGIGRRHFYIYYFVSDKGLTLKAPITTAADDKFITFFPNFRKKGMIFRENRLADDSHENHALFVIFEKAAKF